MTGIAAPAEIAGSAPTATVGGMPNLGRWETFFHFCLSGLTLMAYSVASVPEIVWSAILPGILLILLTWGALDLCKTDPLYLLTAGFWFRITAAVYYGLGGLWRVLASDTTMIEILNFFNPSQEEMNKAQMVGTISIFIVIAVSNLVEGNRRKAISSNFIPVEAEKWIPAIVYCCILVGFPALVYFTMQSFLEFAAEANGLEFEAETNGVRQIANLAYLGMFLALYAGFRGRKTMLLIGIVGTALLLLDGALRMTKQDMLLPLILAAIAHLVWRPTLRNAVLWVAGLGFMFSLFAPFIAYSREQAFVRYGTQDVSLDARLDLIDSYLSGERGMTLGDDYQPWLARITYLPAQAFAVMSYDTGRPGTSLDLAPYVFVPRLLMPDKPMFQPGLDFNEAAMDARNSQSTPTIVAEGYYVGGWLGAIFWMSLYGAAIGLYSREAIRRLRAGHIVFLPVVLIALQAGQAADGWIIGVVLGNGVVIAFAYAASWAAQAALRYLWSGTERPQAA
jgi:hypothetical protein